MNSIEKLATQLEREFPNAAISLDRPSRSSGTWWLDITKGRSTLHVGWSRKKGFGISSPDPAAFGAGHAEVYAKASDATKRIRSLLKTGEQTKDPIATGLREVRQAKKLSQTDLAKKLRINQAALSKLERRNDMLVSTLGDLVKALGGELEIVAKFDDRKVRLR